MRICIGSDHRGFHLKEKLKQWLLKEGHEVTDCGASEYNVADDYPDFAFPVADYVSQTNDSIGIVLCGSGVGVAIAANKVQGIRCVMAMNKDVVQHSRMHDNCNVIAFSADHTTEEDAKEMIQKFLQTSFQDEERFVRRIRKIERREH